MDEGQSQTAGQKLVPEAAVDILVAPTLGWHGVDETDLDTREALGHLTRIVDDIGDAQVVPGLLPIVWARPAHFRERTLQAEIRDVGSQIEETLERRDLGSQATGMLGTLGVCSTGHVHRQRDVPLAQCWQERLPQKGVA